MRILSFSELGKFRGEVLRIRLPKTGAAFYARLRDMDLQLLHDGNLGYYADREGHPDQPIALNQALFRNGMTILTTSPEEISGRHFPLD